MFLQGQSRKGRVGSSGYVTEGTVVGSHLAVKVGSCGQNTKRKPQESHTFPKKLGPT